jgi:hypothetical protein
LDTARCAAGHKLRCDDSRRLHVPKPCAFPL